MGNAMRVSRNDDATPRSRRDLLESGVSRRALAGSRWSSPHRGFHRDTVVNDPARQRILDAAVLLPDGGAVAGWAAAYLHGVSYLDGRDEPVLLAVPPGRLINRPGIAIMRAKLDPGDLVTRHGLPCTGGARTAFDMLRRAPGLVEAVVAGDCLLHSGLVTEPALAHTWRVTQGVVGSRNSARRCPCWIQRPPRRRSPGSACCASATRACHASW